MKLEILDTSMVFSSAPHAAAQAHVEPWTLMTAAQNLHAVHQESSAFVEVAVHASPWSWTKWSRRPLDGRAATPCNVSVVVDQVEQALNAAARVAPYLTSCRHAVQASPWSWTKWSRQERNCQSGVLSDRQCRHTFMHLRDRRREEQVLTRLPEWRPM